jgi:prepilin-type processing-associated H-X9-DG protein
LVKAQIGLAAFTYEGPKEENIARHGLKANVTFLDGHGEAKSVNYLLSKNSKEDTFWDPAQ